MDVAHRVPEAAILIEVTNRHKLVSFIIEGEVWRGRDHERLDTNGSWRMTGSAEKCFSMNGVAVQRTLRGAKTSEA